jgi:hypothetical protein
MLSYRRHFHCGSIPWYENYNWSTPHPENDPWDDLPKEKQWAWGTEFYEEQKMLIGQQGMHRITYRGTGNIIGMTHRMIHGITIHRMIHGMTFHKKRSGHGAQNSMKNRRC